MSPVEFPSLSEIGRRIGKLYKFLEDVSEDVRFAWEFLADVKMEKESKNEFNFFNEINVCQEFPIKTYVFRLMK